MSCKISAHCIYILGEILNSLFRNINHFLVISPKFLGYILDIFINFFFLLIFFSEIEPIIFSISYNDQKLLAVFTLLLKTGYGILNYSQTIFNNLGFGSGGS